MLDGDVLRELAGHAVPHHGEPLRPGGIGDGERVVGELVEGVAGVRAARVAVTTKVERDHARPRLVEALRGLLEVPP